MMPAHVKGREEERKPGSGYLDGRVGAGGGGRERCQGQTVFSRGAFRAAVRLPGQC